MIDLTLRLRAQLRRAPARGVGRALVDALRRTLAEGVLPAGQPMPASRALAADLRVGRNTVTQAYEQLATEGWLAATRQGTVVAHRPVRAAMPESSAGEAPSACPPLAHRVAAPRHLPPEDDDTPRPFLPGMPALDEFPLDAWRRVVRRAWQSMDVASLSAPDVRGQPVLRAAIASHLHAARGVRCDADQVVVTSGTQESLALCAQLFADPGDRAWIEHPGYLGAQAALSGAGLELVPVPVDAEGIAPEASLWRRRRPRLVYTTPSHQYPLGVLLSLARRQALVDGARRAGAWILEDDYDSEFCRGVPLAAMQGLAPDAPVIYLGTFSKVLYPSLRLGYLVLPRWSLETTLPALARRLVPGRVAEQEALAAFIHEGAFSAHLRRMRRLYAERHLALREALGRHWPWPAAMSPGEGGMHLAVPLPASLPDVDVVRRAQAAGLQPRAISAWSVPGARPVNGLVLGYANLPADEADPQVRRLVRTLSA